MNYMSQKPTEQQGEIYASVLMAGDFNTPLSVMDSNSEVRISVRTQLN